MAICEIRKIMQPVMWCRPSVGHPKVGWRLWKTSIRSSWVQKQIRRWLEQKPGFGPPWFCHLYLFCWRELDGKKCHIRAFNE